jgi:hypothetical protein
LFAGAHPAKLEVVVIGAASPCHVAQVGASIAFVAARTDRGRDRRRHLDLERNTHSRRPRVQKMKHDARAGSVRRHHAERTDVAGKTKNAAIQAVVTVQRIQVVGRRQPSPLHWEGRPPEPKSGVRSGESIKNHR